MSLLESINQARDFSIWLHERTNDKKRSGGVRERTGESILRLSLDVDDAILVLLKAGLPGPALTFDIMTLAKHHLYRYYGEVGIRRKAR